MKTSNAVMKEPIAVALPKAAIYCRYSTEHQDESSLTDQIRECRRWADYNGFSTPKELEFSDAAKSGTNPEREGLNELLKAAEAGEFQAVLVLNLARLARSLTIFIDIIAELEYRNVELVSVSEGLRTSQPMAKMAMSMMGLINQQMVEANRQDTRKAQVGLIDRGYIAGGVGYGYRSKRVGKTFIDSRKRLRSDGAQAKIVPEEAEVVRRIYKEWIEGHSVGQIVRNLNNDLVPSRKKGKKGKGWAGSTVSGILQNEVFLGKYIWGRTSKKRNPKTRKVEIINKPRSEWLIIDVPEMRIIDDDTWAKAQARWEEVNAIYPKGHGKGFSQTKKKRTASPNEMNPRYLLSGSLRCGACGGAITLEGGKNGGYYACQNAHNNDRCSCRKMIPRHVLEDLFINKLRDELFNEQALKVLFASVRESIKANSAHLPKEEAQLNRQLEGAEKKISNYLKAIGDGVSSESVTAALLEEEKRKGAILTKLDQLKTAKQNVPELPSEEWIQERVKDLINLLQTDVEKAALLIRQIFGEITLTWIEEKPGEGYFEASCTMRALALFYFVSNSSSKPFTDWRCRESNPGPERFQQ